jgi:hypothetical protein
VEAHLSASLQITPKGVDEIRHRTYKLNIRKRSVLILLATPQSVKQVLDRSVFPKTEILEEINTLVRDGFIAMSGDGAHPLVEMPKAIIAAPLVEDDWRLLDDVVLSEAKFQLVDFCVDSFGARSQAFVDELRECKNAKDIDTYLRQIVAAAEKVCPERLPLLQRLVKEINETA